MPRSAAASPRPASASPRSATGCHRRCGIRRVQDCARAFAWLRAHVAEYGGDPERLFVSGQSAGGHLAALLALDPQYLRALEVPDGTIRGAIPISGVYTIPALPANTRGLMGMFPTAFGCDREVCRAASPVA